MVQDVVRQGISPATGSEVGSQSVVDFNLKVDGVLYVPASENNTLNGGKDQDGAIKLSLNAEGDLILNSYANGKWTEYLAVLDGLKSIGGITLSGNDVTVVAPVKWRINGVNYQKLTNTILTVNSATDGFKRIDYIYADTSNNILLIEGTEVEDGNPYIPPTLPANTVMVAPVYISGDTVLQPIPDLSIYITKNQADQWYIRANPIVAQIADIFIEGVIDIGDSSANTKVLTIHTTGDAAGAGAFITNNVGGSIDLKGYFLNLDADVSVNILSDLTIQGSVSKLTGSGLFEVTDPKDYVQAGYITDNNKDEVDFISFGGKPDSLTDNTASITNGSNIITISSGIFSVDDVGKKIAIYNGLGINSILESTISTFINNNQIIISDNVSFTGASIKIQFGTDNTGILQSVKTYIGNRFRNVYFKNKGTGSYYFSTIQIGLFNGMTIYAENGVNFNVPIFSYDVFNSSISINGYVSITSRAENNTHDWYSNIAKNKNITISNRVVFKPKEVKTNSLINFGVYFGTDNYFTGSYSIINDNSVTINTEASGINSLLHPIQSGQSISASFSNISSSTARPFLVFKTDFNDYLVAYSEPDGSLTVAYKNVGQSLVLGTFKALDELYESYLVAKSVCTLKLSTDGVPCFYINGVDLGDGSKRPVLSNPITSAGFGVYSTDSTSSVVLENIIIQNENDEIVRARKPLFIDFFGDSKTADIVGGSVTNCIEYLNFTHGQNIGRVRNFAVPGENTSNQLYRFSITNIDETNIVYIALGTNDIQQQRDITGWLSEMDYFRTHIIPFGKFLIIEIPELWYGIDQSGEGVNAVNYQNGSSYRTALKTYCAKYNIPCVDMAELLKAAVFNYGGIRDNIHDTSFNQQIKGEIRAKAIIDVWLNDGNSEISLSDNFQDVFNRDSSLTQLEGTGTRPVAAQADGTLVIDTGGARLAGGNVFTGGHQDIRNDGDVRVYNTASGASNYNSTLNSGGLVLTSTDNNTITTYGQNFLNRLHSSGFYSRLIFATPASANREYTLPDSGGSIPVVLPIGAFSHASPPTNTSTGARGSVWYDPVSKDKYEWIDDNVVARYFADPSF